MATGHFFTTKGKLFMLQGSWDDAGATNIRAGLLAGSAAPAALDTQVEVENVNFVTDLLALSGVAEPTNGWYSRKNLTRSNVSEDDTNDRVNMDASDLTWTAADQSFWGLFIFQFVTNDTDSPVISVDIFATPFTANGGDFTYGIADLYRAV